MDTWSHSFHGQISVVEIGTSSIRLLSESPPGQSDGDGDARLLDGERSWLLG